MDQVIQIAGAVLVVIAFAALQMGRLKPDSYTYLLVNLFGSMLLATLAVIERQWGFFLLEVAWASVSLWGRARRLTGHALQDTE